MSHHQHGERYPQSSALPRSSRIGTDACSALPSDAYAIKHTRAQLRAARRLKLGMIASKRPPPFGVNLNRSKELRAGRCSAPPVAQAVRGARSGEQ
jgi:hypothetical protein